MNLLIVDDEYYSAESTKKKITENTRFFEEIYCAYNITQGLECFARHDIAVMILDIEMPGGSGLELLDHIRRQGLDTICIFLTAYAKFEYISKAMRLTSIDYLLKPVAMEELLAAVSKAVDQYRRQASAKLNMQQAGYWKENALYLWELFWLDLSEGAIASQQQDIINELTRRNLNPAAAGTSYLILLIQCNHMEKIPIEKDLYEFTLKNIVREYFYGRKETPITVRINRQFYFLPLPETGRSREAMLSTCRQALHDFVPLFPNTLNFYIPASGCRIWEFPDFIHNLLDAAGKNVSKENHVFDLAIHRQTEDKEENLNFPSSHWTDLLLQRKENQLLSMVTIFLNSLQHSKHVTKDTLANFSYSFLQILFSCMETTNAEALPSFREQISRSSLEQAYSSIQDLINWVSSSLELYGKCLSDHTAGQDRAVMAVKKHIRTHLNQELTRESLAAMVYLTPDYLSHLFKWETGFSLTNYIIYERIEEAKRLLAGSDMSISDIAIRCGFQSISYFSKQFKRFTGMTPREFRG